MSLADLSVGIVGAGPAGLALAGKLLERPGFDVKVFDYHVWDPKDGNGISLNPSAMSALDYLGLKDKVVHRSWKEDASSSAANQPLFFHMYDVRKEGTPKHLASLYGTNKDDEFVSIHRGALGEIMTTQPRIKPNQNLFLNMRVKRVVNVGNQVRIDFEPHDNGWTPESRYVDLLIGADGANSVVRGALNKDISGASAVEGGRALKYVNVDAFRAIVNPETIKNTAKRTGLTNLADHIHKTPVFLNGAGFHAAIYPLGQEKVNVIAFKTWGKNDEWWQQPWNGGTKEIPNQELLRRWPLRESAFLRDILLNSPKTTYSPIREFQQPLKSAVNGRVILIGDAAHAGMPALGSYTSLAFEDAAFMHMLLTDPRVNKGNLNYALRSFDAIRLPRANSILTDSMPTHKQYEFLDDEKNPAKLRAKWQQVFQGIWSWRWNQDKERLNRWLANNNFNSGARDGGASSSRG